MKMAAGDAITCTAVTTRLSTYVTCHFGFDVSKNKRDMNVQFFYPDMAVRAETPLMCNYDGTDNLKCLLSKDVIFDRKVSDDISFTRPPAVDKVGGQYVCQVAPPLANTDIVPCKLTFIDVFLLLIIIAVIVVCVLFYICRERIRKWCSGPIRQNWPGATGDPEELETAVKASAVEEGGSQGEPLLARDSPEDFVLQEIPQGLPQFFFKMGWTDGKARAEREMEAKNALAQGQRQKNKDMQGTTAQEAADQTQSPSFWQRNSWIPGSTRKEEKRQQTKEPNPKSHGTEGRQGNPFVKRYEEEDDFVDASQGDTDLQHLGASHPPVNVPIASEAIYVLDTAGQRGSQTESKKEKKARKDKEQKEKKAKEKEKKEKEKKEKEEKKAEEDRLKAEAKAAKQKK
ncbi:hypothetical protein ACOMHN_061121 [Nucella lapillus]